MLQAQKLTAFAAAALLGHINAGNPAENDRWTVWVNNDGESRMNQNQSVPPGTIKTGSSKQIPITSIEWNLDGSAATVKGEYEVAKPNKPVELWLLVGELQIIGNQLQGYFKYSKAAAPDVILATTTPSFAQEGWEFDAPE